MKSLLGALQDGRLVELPTTQKEDAFRYLAHLIEAIPDITQKMDLADAIVTRERSASSGIGLGVACPHVRLAYEGDLVCALGWSPEGLDYGASDGRKVHLLVMYLIPENHRNTYLKEVSALTGAVQKAGGVQAIEKAQDITSVREHLLGWVSAAIDSGPPSPRVRMIQLEARQQEAARVEASAPGVLPGPLVPRTMDRKLDEVRGRVGRLGALVTSIVALDLKMLEDPAGTEPTEVGELAARMDPLEDEIDTHVLNLFALHQPVASDVRFLYAIPKIVSDLGRSGGQALRLAHAIPGFRSRAPAPLQGLCRSAIDSSRGVLRNALDAFLSGSATLAAQIAREEDDVERCCGLMFQEVISSIQGQRTSLREAFSWSLIPHHVERIAHYARGISEEVLFWTQGQKVRHRHGEGAPEVPPSTFPSGNR